MSSSSLVPTIQIIDDPSQEERGYSLEGREFFIRGHGAVETEATWLDGTKFKEKYYEVDLKEYMRVVPEAANENHDWTDIILMPSQLCHLSFKPMYIK